MGGGGHYLVSRLLNDFFSSGTDLIVSGDKDEVDIFSALGSNRQEGVKNTILDAMRFCFHQEQTYIILISSEAFSEGVICPYALNFNLDTSIFVN